MLSEISFTNFKSLKSVTIPLRGLSFFCGPNASGKTNFAEALDFLSNVFRNGLQYAVGDKGGFYNMCFRRMRRSKGDIVFKVAGTARLSKKMDADFEIEFSLGTSGEAIRADFEVATERYRFRLRGREDKLAPLILEISRSKDDYHAVSSDPKHAYFANLHFEDVNELNTSLTNFFTPRSQQLLVGPAFGWDFLLESRGVAQELEGIRVFQINARVARQPGTPSVGEAMGRHGENLPMAVAAFLANTRLAPRLQTWMEDVIPDFEALQVKYTFTKQVGLFLQERGFGAPWYAEDLSDGTIMCLGLFLCLLEPSHRMILIEEPENSLHPWLLQRFLERAREVSGERQIAITTHSPLTVAAAKPEELFLIERREGMTEIIPATWRDPNVSEIIRKNVLDLGEYWLSGGLGGVPSAPEGETDADDSKNDSAQ